MARVVKASRTTRPQPRKRAAAAPVSAAAKPGRAELLAQIEKLELANAAARAKSRAAVKAAKEAAARVAELEQQVAALEKATAARPPRAPRRSKPAAPPPEAEPVVKEDQHAPESE